MLHDGFETRLWIFFSRKIFKTSFCSTNYLSHKGILLQGLNQINTFFFLKHTLIRLKCPRVSSVILHPLPSVASPSFLISHTKNNTFGRSDSTSGSLQPPPTHTSSKHVHAPHTFALLLPNFPSQRKTHKHCRTCAFF